VTILLYIYISGSAVFNKSGSESFMPTRSREGVGQGS
jgi:hypothetical protein